MPPENSEHRPYADAGELRVSLDAIRDQLARIEKQTIKTNGRVTALEAEIGQFDLWRAELKGIAQGAGGTGRLLFYVLSSGAAAGSTLVVLLTLTGHLK
jgi:hypothetical protein